MDNVSEGAFAELFAVTDKTLSSSSSSMATKQLYGTVPNPTESSVLKPQMSTFSFVSRRLLCCQSGHLIGPPMLFRSGCLTFSICSRSLKACCATVPDSSGNLVWGPMTCRQGQRPDWRATCPSSSTPGAAVVGRQPDPHPRVRQQHWS